MLFRSVRPRPIRFQDTIAAALLAPVLLAAALNMPATARERPHADGPNSGFADVETAPAARPANVSGIGTFAPGAGAVTAADGTLYLGNQQGQVMAFQPDGTRLWSRNITAGHAILASPVVDSEGAIYVIGTRTVRNDLVDPPLVRHNATLFKFTAAGDLAWQTPFPTHPTSLGPTTSAPPNIWRANGAEVIMVPVYHPDPYGYDVRLLAIGRNGAVLDDTFVFEEVNRVSGGSGISPWCYIPPVGLSCWLAPDFNPSGDDYVADPATRLPADVRVPHPGVAVFNFPGAGTPFILMSNQFHDLIGFTFTSSRFNEIFRVRNGGRLLLSPPMVTADGHTAIVTSNNEKSDAKLLFAGPNMNARTALRVPASVAVPTRLPDGRIVIVGNHLQMAVIGGGSGSGAAVTRNVTLPGESIVPAAASRNHLFVSTAGSFLTYDAGSLEKQAEIFWMGGGTFTPVIGPFGHVYAMASNILFVFPPPTGRSAAPDLADPGAPILAPEPGAPTLSPKPTPTQNAAQKFDPPLTTAGNRLFACTELDGDDCGKSDARGIATAFCQAQGFAAAGNYATEQRKGKAETMDGRFCARNKCKVFDRITCE
ncbi:MAG: PQQ-like beta-propeller repeat protein [Rhodospirillaceae bacterium]|nr:PQQ-like beta-propeller repeat protein [Rhodospirillaceae bacterium]